MCMYKYFMLDNVTRLQLYILLIINLVSNNMETVYKYHSSQYLTMFRCFLDALRPFDRVKHAKLFHKLY